MKYLIFLIGLTVFNCASPLEPFRDCEEFHREKIIAEGDGGIIKEIKTGEICEYHDFIETEDWKLLKETNDSIKKPSIFFPEIIELPPCDSGMVYYHFVNGEKYESGTYYDIKSCEFYRSIGHLGLLENTECRLVKGCVFN